MNTFKKQFAGLTPSAQTRFRRTWGDAPWDHHEYRKLHHRRIWKAELFAAPLPPRWEPERLRPESPLWMALRAKKRRAAKAILKRTDALTRKEAAGCALLTLQWAPDLLGEILDKTPGRPISWLQHEVTLDPHRQLKLVLRGSLVMIAAALNDLAALEVLLSRGGRADFDFTRDRWDIVGDLLMGGVTMGALGSPDYSLCQKERGVSNGQGLLRADPLSAAIFSNAGRCALRLLEEPSVTVTSAVCRALVMTPIRETQQAVAERLGTPLEDLLLPEHFGPKLDHPLLPAVLRRHDGILPREKLEAMLRIYQRSPVIPTHRRDMEVFSLIDPALLGDGVWEVWQKEEGRSELLEIARAFALPVDRCRVSERIHRETLLKLMDHFRIVGDPPEGGLSGLACALLWQLRGNVQTPPMPAEQLLRIPGAARVLETEDPKLLLAWLEEQEEEITSSRILPLKALLDIRKEVDYEL